MKSHETTELVMMLIAAFPTTKADERTVAVFKQMLSDLEFEPAKRAVALLLATVKFFPSIAEVREAYANIQHGPIRPGGEAWGDVLEAVHRVGYYRAAPDFPDPVVAECVKRFGWRALCLNDGVSDRARFIELYDALAKQRRLELVSGVTLPKRLGPAFTPRRLSGASVGAKALTQGGGSDRAATGKPGGKDGPSRVSLPVVLQSLPAPTPTRVWTGRRLTVEELEAELGATPPRKAGGRG